MEPGGRAWGQMGGEGCAAVQVGALEPDRPRSNPSPAACLPAVCPWRVTYPLCAYFLTWNLGMIRAVVRIKLVHIYGALGTVLGPLAIILILDFKKVLSLWIPWHLEDLGSSHSSATDLLCDPG